ncbi:T-cell leukemia homeobox protein 2 isoform X2 [Danio rerio]|uniref:T-cell leukemia homeobox protein 2 isoform X2 n=1 Tax=Danio rerio TaxID=7955 RepID=A0AC58H5J0_DANRE
MAGQPLQDPSAAKRITEHLGRSCSVPVLRHTADRSSVPEPDTTEAKKAAYVVQPRADLRAGETLSPAEISGVRGARHTRQGLEDDRRSSQNLVSKQKNKMEEADSGGEGGRATASQPSDAAASAGGLSEDPESAAPTRPALPSQLLALCPAELTALGRGQ